MQLNHARLLRGLCLGLFAVAAAVACTSVKDDATPVTSDYGAVQPDTNGKFVTEDSACAQLTSAETKARSQLSCDAAKRGCPEYIRPAGGEGCFEYDQGSVAGCAKLYAAFTSCADFDAHPCLLSAKSSCTDSDGEGGSGGAPSASGADGGAAGTVALPLPEAGAGG